MKTTENREEILSGNLVKAILTLTIPVIINSFLQTMYNLTDTFWLGKLGTNELAAINLVTPIQNVVINFGSGITVAGSVLISQYIGAHKDKDARSMANQIFACAMIFSIVCASLVAAFANPLITWLGADGETYRLAKVYLQTVIMDMPFLYIVNMYVSIHQAEGDTVKPMLMNVCGISINMVLDPLFMIVFDMGTFGAAFATVLAKAIPAVAAIILLHSKKQLIYLELNKIKFEKDKLIDIARVGLPTAIGGSTTQLGFLLMSKNVFKYGAKAMAAYGIGNKINGLISLPSNGIGSAISIVVGQNFGARQIERADKAFKIACVMSVSFLLVGGMILSRNFISTAIVSIFSEDAEVIVMAADFLSIMAFWCFANGFYNSSSGLYRGSGHTLINMIVDVSRLWIFRFATLFFCEYILKIGVRSIWYSVVVSNAIAALIHMIAYFTNFWRKNKIKTD